ncbi:TIGR03790 family protein [Crenobacter caeni]|uniref:TIGR03790 family protein n=1 Tax=Crenobacter caeni TaxID=2705474 RepID=A0A6B2KRH1_9NEIS|nr:TIGR03790 family protein [Crenobacter caeni]NDV12673.1 TIGR03790 family protein [Crenobacter caeni]
MLDARACLALAALLAAALAHGGASPDARTLAVLFRAADPAGEAAARAYAEARGVPASHLIAVHVPKGAVLAPAALPALRREIERKLPAGTRALALAWTEPYAVGCNSVTSALTLGFDARQCTETCAAGRDSPFFNAKGPLKGPLLPPSMLLTDDAALTRTLARRGRAAQAPPDAAAYFVVSGDAARDSRARFFPPEGAHTVGAVRLVTLKGRALAPARGAMFVFTGDTDAHEVARASLLPGALADHLTSFGGVLAGGTQMPATAWLKAGASASYGTVSEPCNWPQKFPHPQVLVARYLAGDTALEAYWKSVLWPAQGLFVGDPLAAPYAAARR